MTALRKLTFVLALSTALVATPVLAQARAPKAAPVSELVKAVTIPHESFTLPNGLRVIVHEDRKVPVVAVSIWYRVGSKHEPKGKTGFAHLFEHLMFNGSENAPKDFFEPLQQIGATDVNGTTWLDRTNYFQTVPTGALDLTLFLESDRMGHLLGAVTQEKLDAQRGVVQNEKRQGDNQPFGLLWYDIQENLFPKGHPYHHNTIGSMADLDAASMDDVRKWFTDNYGPNNAVLVLAGDIDVATAKERVTKWFGGIARGPDIAVVNGGVPTLPAPLAKVAKDQIPTTRIHRMWTYGGLNDPDAMHMQLAASVLGGLSSSRLDNALVRREAVAVGVSSFTVPFEDASIFVVQADVKPGVDPAHVVKRLDEEVAAFIKGGPTADELQRASASYLGGAIAGLEAVGGFSGKAVALAEGALYSNNPAFYRTELERLAQATPASVTAAMGKWLTRPVFSLTYEPGERAAGGEARGGAAVPGAALDIKAPSAAPAYFANPAFGDVAQGAPRASVDRSTFPPVGDLKGLDFPTIERAKLRNGIEVVFARRAAVPTVNVAVSFDAGYAADPKDALGTQSLLLSLMGEGTTSMDSTKLAEAQERLGAQISGSAGNDETVFSLFALRPNLAASINLLADYVRNPALDAKELDRIRALQLTRIESETNDPNSLASRTIAPLLYGKAHPYGIPPSGRGDASAVAKVTQPGLAAFHANWLRPDNARIFVVGDTSLKEVVRLLDKSFGRWKAPATPKPIKDFSAPIPAPQPRIVLIDRPNAPQSVIVAGKVLDAKGTDKLEVLRAANEVFGGSFLSRFNTNLRETKGWSYGVRSQITSSRDRVAFLATAPVQADRTGDSIRELQKELTAFLSDKGVTEPELTRMANGNVRELPGSFETSGDVLNGLQTIVRFGRPDDYYEKLADTYRGMTAGALDAAARASLGVDGLVYVVVGDAASVKPQLDALGLPVETVAPAGPSAK
jgi:zinc protease